MTMLFAIKAKFSAIVDAPLLSPALALRFFFFFFFKLFLVSIFSSSTILSFYIMVN
jgi:hypothetical protein